MNEIDITKTIDAFMGDNRERFKTALLESLVYPAGIIKIHSCEGKIIVRNVSYSETLKENEE